MSILQWNIRGLRPNFNDLSRFLNSHNPIIVALQETKLSSSYPVHVPHYIIFRQDLFSSTIAHGGTMLAIHSSIPCRRLQITTDLQTIAVRCHLGGREVSVCSLYLPPGCSFPRGEVEHLISSLPSPYFILGDFNAHSPFWGCDARCPRGQILEDLLINFNIGLLNTGTYTHCTMPSGSMSALDLSLCSPRLQISTSWTVDKFLYGSDHFPIWIRINEVPGRGIRPPRWNFKRADWNRFESLTREALGEPTSLPSVEEFTEVIVTCAEQCIPLTSSRPKRCPVPWWTDSCSEALRARRRCWRQFRQNSTVTNMLRFRHARAFARRTFREAKRTSWVAYVSGINRQSSISSVWNRIKRISGKYCPSPLPSLRINGEDVVNPVDVAEEIGRFLAERCRANIDDPVFAAHKQQCEMSPADFSTTCYLPYNSDFTIAELEAVVRSLKDVAEGPDRVHNMMLKHLPRPVLTKLLQAFNSLWRGRQLPESWREAIVIPILKQGKNGDSPSDYRPISLTSSMCKVMEKLVVSRLTWFLEHSRLMNPVQCGFRRGHSTVDHLVTIDSRIREGFKRGHHTGALFFDVEKAYDTTWRHGILAKLFRCGVRGNMGEFVQNFLSRRKFRVRIANSLSCRFDQAEGVPQGSVLSVALFAIMINDIDSNLPPSIGRSLFVDDFAIWCSSRSTVAVQRQLQLAVNKIETWGSVNGFRFSTSKTVGVHFCRRRGACPDMMINMYGSAISFQSSARFLGVILDSRLSYRDHILQLRTTCQQALNVLKTVSRMRYGADRRSLLLLYRSLIRSRLDYASIVYDLASNSAKRPIDTVHHAGVRIATGAFRTTPIVSLLVEADEAPLALRRQELSMRYSCKLAQNPANPAYAVVFCEQVEHRLHHSQGALSFGSRVKLLLDACGVCKEDILKQECTAESPWQLSMPRVDTSLTARHKGVDLPQVLLSGALERIQEYEGYTAVYTDGSRLSNGVGCAAVCGDSCRSYPLPPCASIFTAELHAIILALLFILSSSSRMFLILSDSLSSILSLRRFNHHPILQNIFILHNRIHQQGKRVVFCWIPAHVGIMGNERADRAAKRAAERDFYSYFYNFPIPYSDFNPIIHRFITSRWQHIWDNCGPQKLKEIKPHIGNWVCAYRRRRSEEVALCRLRVGHTYDTHRHLLMGQPHPICDTCNAQLTVKHILLDCSVHDEARRRILGSGQSLDDCLGKGKSVILDGRLFEFVMSTNFNIIFSGT